MDDSSAAARIDGYASAPLGLSLESASTRAPDTVTTLFFAFACGALAANLYYAQPIVALIGSGLGLSLSMESAIVTAAQIGYALGLVFLVPLGDVFANRRLILLTMAMNVAALIGLALAPGMIALFALTLVVGITSVAAQMIVPLAATLAPASQRGRVVGNIMTGLVAGILLARPVSSFVADFVGWRGVFWMSAALVAVLAVAGLRLLPERVPSGRRGYGALIASLAGLLAREPVLRRRGLYHAAMFASFSLFWTAAPIILLREPYGYSSAGVALFALVGVLGVFAAPVAGRLADAGHSRAATIGALATVVTAFVLVLFGDTMVLPLVLAGVLVDLGVQANLVLGQREIYQLDESIRNRLNAVYMTIFFVGGALGSALASPVLELFGWWGICLIGAALPATALIYFVAADRPT